MQNKHQYLGPASIGGHDWLAKTNIGRDINVWSPYNHAASVGAAVQPNEGPLLRTNVPMIQRAHRMASGMTNFTRNMVFCHGHSLGTFELFGYCVYGGLPLVKVLEDEYRLVGTRALAGAKAGDIIVLWNAANDIIHSAKLEIVPNDKPTEETVKVSSKDTFSGFSHVSLDHFLRMWSKSRFWQTYSRL